jgi:ADP-ribosylglycohydrolase
MDDDHAGYLRSDKELIFSEWDRSGLPLPPRAPMSPALTRKVRGMLAGLAVGDALGNTTEGLDPARRQSEFGEIRDYLPNHRAGDRAVGLPAADSQLAFFTLESLLEKGQLDPGALAEVYTSSHLYNVDDTMKGFVLVWKMVSAVPGFAWWDAGQPSAGSGALSRMAATVLPYLHKPTRSFWDDAVCATALTHRDEMAVTAGVGFAGLLAECLSLGESGPPAPEWPFSTFLRYARAFEERELSWKRTYRTNRAVNPFEGTLCEYLDVTLPAALAIGMPVRQACAAWESGSFLMETIPSLLYLLALHADDPEEALIRAVNDTRDNDTIAALAGAVVGALHGEDALPERWLRGLLGRTRYGDDGCVQVLLVRAVARYVMGEFGA